MKQTDAHKHYVSHLLKVLDYIERHLDDPLHLTTLAKIAHISPFHFHRVFRALVGETVAAYVRRLRLERAANRLRSSEASITEIALDAGYETPSAFTKAYKQVIGTSPREYRQRDRSDLPVVTTNIPVQEKTMLKPTFITKEPQTVAYVRRTGSYQSTPPEAFIHLKDLVRGAGMWPNIKAFYGMGLDNPEVTDEENLRFDACAAVTDTAKIPEGLGEKTLSGGRYAVFPHEGPYASLEETFNLIFSQWYPTSGEKLADSPCFAELVDMMEDDFSGQGRKARIYIPLV